MRLTWLADTLRKAGLNVLELDGWQTRGVDQIRPQGVVIHHTVTGPTVPDPIVDNLLRLGHSKLKGPLAQLGLRRDGTFVVVAAGRANHNGYGLWGNDSIGIEAYNDGQGEPWPAGQMKAYTVGVAALCKRMGFGPERVKGHKETDPGRKIDPTFDMGGFRAGVAAALAVTPQPVDPPAPADPAPIEEMAVNMLYDRLTWRTFYEFADGQIVEVTAAKHHPYWTRATGNGDGWDGPIRSADFLIAVLDKKAKEASA